MSFSKSKVFRAPAMANSLPYLENAHSTGNKLASNELSHYQITRPIIFRSGVNLNYLTNAIRRIISDNPGLSSFYTLDEKKLWHQVIPKSCNIPIYFFSLDGIPNLDEITKENQCNHNQPLVPENSPLLTLRIGIFNKEPRIMYVKCHHTLCDGFSLLLLARKLAKYYKEEIEDVHNIDNTVTYSEQDIDEYFSLNLTERNSLNSSYNNTSLKWWRLKLSSNLKTHSDIIPADNFYSFSFCSINAESYRSFKKMAKFIKVPLNFLFCAIYAKSISQFLNLPNIPLTLQTLNREPKSRNKIRNLSDLESHIVQIKGKTTEQIAIEIYHQHLEAAKQMLPYWWIMKNIYPLKYKAHIACCPYYFNVLPKIPFEFSLSKNKNVRFSLRPDVFATHSNRLFALYCEGLVQYGEEGDKISFMVGQNKGYDQPHDCAENIANKMSENIALYSKQIQKFSKS